MTREDLGATFAAAGRDDARVTARYAVLEAATGGLGRIADRLHVGGFVSRDDQLLATALLARLAAELSSGVQLLLRAGNSYAAGALLRQLIEVEYLLFLGYADPTTLARWYRASPEELRKEFTPHKMRKAADGVFRHEEYWQHCEVGGHPHPASRLLLPQYASALPPTTFLLPDAVQHVRRLWTSLRLLIPKLNSGEQLVGDQGAALQSAIDRWAQVEDPVVLQFDGVPSAARPKQGPQA